MEFLNKNRNKDDLEVLGKICFDTITSPYVSKPNSDEFCGIYIESRNRELTCIEDLAAIKSFKIFSEHNYPVLVFCNNFSNFLGNHKDVKDWRIQFIKINECQSHDDYSLFMIKQLFKIIPKEYENIILNPIMINRESTALQQNFTLNKNFNPGIFQSQQKTIDSLMNDS